MLAIGSLIPTSTCFELYPTDRFFHVLCNSLPYSAVDMCAWVYVAGNMFGDALGGADLGHGIISKPSALKAVPCFGSCSSLLEHLGVCALSAC